MEDERELWFKRRRYGLGWTPVTWQGWAVVGAFVVVLIAGAVPAERAGGAAEAAYLVVVVVAIAALVSITLRKGPTPPRWRWGTSERDDPAEDL